MPLSGERRDYLVECFWTGVRLENLDALDARARAAAGETAETPGEVHYDGSLLVAGDEVVLCFFEGPSVAAVDAVARRAGIPFARIVEAVRVGARSDSAGDGS
jgi:hypothetical protein